MVVRCLVCGACRLWPSSVVVGCCLVLTVVFGVCGCLLLFAMFVFCLQADVVGRCFGGACCGLSFVGVCFCLLRVVCCR